MPSSHPEDRRKNRPPLVALLLFGLVAVIIIALFSADGLINRIVQQQVLPGDTTGGRPVVFLGKLHLNPWTMTLQCDSLALRGTGGDYRLTTGTIAVSGVRWYQFVFADGIGAEEVSVHTPRLILTSRVSDSARATASQARDDTPSSVRSVSIHRLSVLNGSSSFGVKSSIDSLSGVLYDVAIDRIPSTAKEWLQTFGNAAFEMSGATLVDAAGGYRYTCARLSCDTDKGFIRLDSLTIKPASSDSTFFAAAKSRTTRFVVSLGKLSLTGIDLSDAQRNGAFRARTLLLDRLSWSTLVDKRKPNDPNARPRMPNEILSRMDTPIRLDTVHILHGLISYGELFPYTHTPALLHWTNVQATITGIRNRSSHSSDTTEVKMLVSGSLMDRGDMALALEMPLSEETFSLTCRGAVGAMKLDTLNPWLEISDRTRITGGKLDTARFSFRVLSGRASGTTVPIYSGLTIATLNKETGSSKGAVQAIKSLLANVIKITNANPPEPGAPPKEGKISYVRKPTDPFFGYLWSSLKTGLGSVVGFSK